MLKDLFEYLKYVREVVYKKVQINEIAAKGIGDFFKGVVYDIITKISPIIVGIVLYPLLPKGVVALLMLIGIAILIFTLGFIVGRKFERKKGMKSRKVDLLSIGKKRD